MRTCGGCTQCCKNERIPDLNKPSNQWCMYCKIGEGCAIYGNHPKACKDMLCGWLTDENMDEDMRPDRVHLYLYGKLSDEVLRISVDPDYPDAWKVGKGKEVVDYILAKGFHLVVVVDKQINFLTGIGKRQPEKILLDWLL
jgi:hypothetical protein